MHARAAQLLEAHLLADHDLDHARRPQVHRGVALDHDHDVAEGRDVRAAGGRRAEQDADLRHLSRELDLVEEDAARVAAAGEHVDLVGDPCAGGVDQIEEGNADSCRCLLDPDDLLDRASSPAAGLHCWVVGHHRHLAAIDHAEPGDHAIRGQLVGEHVGEEAVLDEGNLVKQ
jgi:hypothetical protein